MSGRKAAAAAALLVLALGSAGAASAASVTWSDLPTTAVLNPLATSTTGTVYENRTGSGGDSRSVWQEDGTDTGVIYTDASAWYSSVTGGATATYNFGGQYSALSFAWGSPDAYNTLTFLLGGVVVDTFTTAGLSAAEILPATFARNGALTTFTDIAGGLFDAVRFSSGSNAFEYANLQALAPVPLPAAGLLLAGALGGLAVLRRRKIA